MWNLRQAFRFIADSITEYFTSCSHKYYLPETWLNDELKVAWKNFCEQRTVLQELSDILVILRKL